MIHGMAFGIQYVMKAPYRFAALLFISTACNSSFTGGKESNTAGLISQAIPTQDDASFLVDAACGQMLEVALSKIAIQKADNPRIRELGEMLVKVHSQSIDDIRKLAAAKRLRLPASLSPKQQEVMEALMAKNGPDFDQSFIGWTMRDHKKDIRAFQVESEKGRDSDIRDFADGSLSFLDLSLDSAQNIQYDLSRK
jgi:putative membrane protein